MAEQVTLNHWVPSSSLGRCSPLTPTTYEDFCNMKKKAVCHWLATFRAKRPWNSETTEFSSLVCSDWNINPLLKGDKKIVAIAS